MRGHLSNATRASLGSTRIRNMLHALHFENWLFLGGRFTASDSGIYGPHSGRASDLDLVAGMALELIGGVRKLINLTTTVGKVEVTAAGLQAPFNCGRAGGAGGLAHVVLRHQPSARNQ